MPAQSDVASDPFFGRVGKMMAANQMDQRLKFEILVPVISSEKPTAICSFNWHQDHFSSKFAIRQADESTAHTACLGFGLERVTLALIKAHGFEPQAWPEAVRQQLPEYMVPSVILLVDSLPVTANGKIDYRALPLPDASATPDKAWTPPQTATEIRLASLWQQVLGTNHIGPDTDFFDTGGTSLNGLRLIQKIRQDFSVTLPLGALFKSPTLSRLSGAIDHASGICTSSSITSAPSEIGAKLRHRRVPFDWTEL